MVFVDFDFLGGVGTELIDETDTGFIAIPFEGPLLVVGAEVSDGDDVHESGGCWVMRTEPSSPVPMNPTRTGSPLISL